MGGVAKQVGNFVGDITGSNRQAEAAEQAAGAQAAMSAETRMQVLREANQLERESMRLANATPQELAALGRSYRTAEQSLRRESRLLASLDPALLEASKQALSLLRGEEASINKPLNDMRAMQRQNLLNSLRAQYGPGAESSSIGQRALQQFDMESNSMFAQNQQSALQQAFGIASSDFGGRLERASAGLQQVGQGYGALRERRLNTRMNVGAQTLGALSGTSQQMIQSAGAPYVGEQLRGQAQQQFMGQAFNLGANYLGSKWASNDKKES
jgi:hypothetical protein